MEGDDSTWQLLTTSSVVERVDTDIHPRLYTSTIIRVTDDCIWFHGKADWDEEAKCGVFTMTFNHVVTFKIVVCPSLEIVIANFYQTSSNQMVMLTHEKHPKPRLFEVVKHNYELALHDLSTIQNNLSSSWFPSPGPWSSCPPRTFNSWLQQGLERQEHVQDWANPGERAPDPSQGGRQETLCPK